ncbi:hypothetical protein DHB64_14930 [Antarcticibacterium sp. W02-3]|nr:hypothetical protein [Antarcticibacterium sp. W02-3]
MLLFLATDDQRERIAAKKKEWSYEMKITSTPFLPDSIELYLIKYVNGNLFQDLMELNVQHLAYTFLLFLPGFWFLFPGS